MHGTEADFDISIFDTKSKWNANKRLSELYLALQGTATGSVYFKNKGPMKGRR